MLPYVKIEVINFKNDLKGTEFFYGFVELCFSLWFMGVSSRYKGVIESGSRLVAEVEVGGWPVPTVTWFKDDEVLTTKTHTENYNGFPNKYVPDGRIEVIRLGKKLKSLNS